MQAQAHDAMNEGWALKQTDEAHYAFCVHTYKLRALFLTANRPWGHMIPLQLQTTNILPDGGHWGSVGPHVRESEVWRPRRTQVGHDSTHHIMKL